MDNSPLYFYFFDKPSLPQPLPFHKDNGQILGEEHLRIWQNIVNDILEIGKKHNYKFRPTDITKNVKEPQNGLAILLASNDVLCDKKTLDRLIQWDLRSILRENFAYIPVLTIGIEDFREVFSESTEEHRNSPYAQMVRNIGYDSRIKFFDSGIWHRYLPVEMRGESSFKLRLDNILTSFKKWEKQGLYKTNAARAALEFQLRMFQNSHIAKMGHRGHYEAVCPFKFHSEYQMKLKADELLDTYFNKYDYKEQLRWHFYLVDDFANEGISTTNGNIHISKKQCIEQLLSDFHVEIDYSKDENATSASSKIVEQSLEDLSGKKRYDIILLDYLLAHKTDIPNTREYGFELLLQLEADSKSTHRYALGPFMRHWIFPISSFPYALTDKLQQLGIDNYHQLWHLSRGGDPITSPQLFRYFLLSFMKQQIEEVLLLDDALYSRFGNYSKLSYKNWINTIKIQLNSQVIQMHLTEDMKEESELAYSIQNLKAFDQHKDFIEKAEKVVTKAIKAKSGKHKDYLDFKANWQNFIQTDLYPKTCDLLKEKFETDILKPEKEAKRRINNMQKNSRTLDLSLLDLREFPAELLSLEQKKQITSLKLDQNRITNLPDSISEFVNLERLYLEYNGLQHLPESIRDLDKLKYLNIKNNEKNRNTDSPDDIAVSKEDVEELIERWIAIKPSKELALEIKEKYLNKGDIKSTIQKLKLLSLPSEENKILSNIDSRFSILQREKAGGIIHFDNEKITLNKILISLNYLIESLQSNA